MKIDPYKIVISGIELTVVNILNVMQIEPTLIGDVYIDETLLSKNCALENFLLQPSGDSLFYVKYHEINRYGYLTVNFFNLPTKTSYEFDREFEKLYLKEFISENEIHIYESFNDQSGNNFYFKLDEEEFGPVD